jgi:hypothetical protein
VVTDLVCESGVFSLLSDIVAGALFDVGDEVLAHGLVVRQHHGARERQQRPVAQVDPGIGVGVVGGLLHQLQVHLVEQVLLVHAALNDALQQVDVLLLDAAHHVAVVAQSGVSQDRVKHLLGQLLLLLAQLAQALRQRRPAERPEAVREAAVRLAHLARHVAAKLVTQFFQPLLAQSKVNFNTNCIIKLIFCTVVYVSNFAVHILRNLLITTHLKNFIIFSKKLKV